MVKGKKSSKIAGQLPATRKSLQALQIRKKMRSAAQKAFANAYSPYSKVKVGSAVLAGSGKIYSGCNIENASFGGTVCAERVAIFNAISQGEKEILMIYVYTVDGWPPCGICRQVIKEFSTADTQIIVGDKKGREQVYNMEEIYPVSFVFKV